MRVHLRILKKGYVTWVGVKSSAIETGLAKYRVLILLVEMHLGLIIIE